MRFLCCDCDHRFTEEDANQTEEIVGEVHDSALQFIEYACPHCGSLDIEDLDNLESVRAMKGHA